MGLKLNDKTKAVIRAVAPTLGAALGGPLGGLAGNVIATALGSEDEKAIEAALVKQNPETLLALRKAEQEFELKCKELELVPEKLATEDRMSARDMAKGTPMKPQMALSGVFVIGYFAIFWLLLIDDMELNVRQATMVNVLMGVLTAGVVKILDFWFGSTAGSTIKSHLLAQSKPADVN